MAAQLIACGCGERWSGVAAAHCAGCHRTFSAPGLFDKHRSARGEHGTCLDPAEVRQVRTGERVMFFRDGMWRGPEMTDEQLAAMGRQAKKGAVRDSERSNAAP